MKVARSIIIQKAIIMMEKAESVYQQVLPRHERKKYPSLTRPEPATIQFMIKWSLPGNWVFSSFYFHILFIYFYLLVSQPPVQVQL